MKTGNVSAEFDTQVELDGDTYDLHVEATGSAFYDAGNSSGPVEHCYPPEGEMTILSVESEIVDSEGRVVTDKARIDRIMAELGEESIEEKLWEVFFS